MSPGDTLRRALSEFDEARTANDELGRRQSAEKAWLAVVQAADWFLASHNILVHEDSRAHSERRRYLLDLGRGDLETSYGHLSQTLHGDIFYLGEQVSPARMFRFFEEAARFVEETTQEAGLVSEVWKRFPQS